MKRSRKVIIRKNTGLGLKNDWIKAKLIKDPVQKLQFLNQALAYAEITISPDNLRILKGIIDSCILEAGELLKQSPEIGWKNIENFENLAIKHKSLLSAPISKLFLKLYWETLNKVDLKRYLKKVLTYVENCKDLEVIFEFYICMCDYISKCNDRSKGMHYTAMAEEIIPKVLKDEKFESSKILKLHGMLFYYKSLFLEDLGNLHSSLEYLKSSENRLKYLEDSGDFLSKVTKKIMQIENSTRTVFSKTSSKARGFHIPQKAKINSICKGSSTSIAPNLASLTHRASSFHLHPHFSLKNKRFFREHSLENESKMGSLHSTVSIAQSTFRSFNYGLIKTTELIVLGQKYQASYSISSNLKKLRIQLISQSQSYSTEFDLADGTEILSEINEKFEPFLTVKEEKIELVEESETVFVQFMIQSQVKALIKVIKFFPRENYKVLVTKENMSFSKFFTGIELLDATLKEITVELFAFSINAIDNDAVWFSNTEVSMVYAKKQTCADLEYMLVIYHARREKVEMIFIQSSQEPFIFPLRLDKLTIERLINIDLQIPDCLDTLVNCIKVQKNHFIFDPTALHLEPILTPTELSLSSLNCFKNLVDQSAKTQNFTDAKSLSEIENEELSKRKSKISSGEISEISSILSRNSDIIEFVIEKVISGKNFKIQFCRNSSKIIASCEEEHFTVSCNRNYPSTEAEYQKIVNGIVLMDDNLAVLFPNHSELKYFKKKHIRLQDPVLSKLSKNDSIIFRTSILNDQELYQVSITKMFYPLQGTVLILHVISGDRFNHELAVELVTAASKSGLSETDLIPICNYLAKNVLVFSKGVCYLDFNMKAKNSLNLIVKLQARIRGMITRKRFEKKKWTLVFKNKILANHKKFGFLLFRQEKEFFIRIVKDIKVCGVNLNTKAITAAGFSLNMENFIREKILKNIQISEAPTKITISGLEMFSQPS